MPKISSTNEKFKLINRAFLLCLIQLKFNYNAIMQLR